jgi:hypothetical protein
MQTTTKSSAQHEDLPKVWYKEFWAWFVLAPLIFVIMVSIYTVSLAVRYADDRVIDNYYKHGRTINNRMDEELVAASLGLEATLVFEQSISELAITLRSNNNVHPEAIELEFSHPSDQSLDHVVVLQHIAKGRYQAELAQALSYRWYLRLRPVSSDSAANALWRLRGEIDFLQQASVTLSAEL